MLLAALVLLTGFSSATVTSADSITYNSNNEFFNGELFAVSVTADRATDKIDIFLDQSELSGQVDGEVKQDLRIQFENQDSELRYSTTKSIDLRNIETLAPYNPDGFSTEQEAINDANGNCVDLNFNGEANAHLDRYSDGFFNTKYEVYCYQRNQYLGTPAYIDNPDEIFSVDAVVDADGKDIQRKTLSNGDTGTGVVTDLGSHAKVRWNGNLGTGASTPDINRVLALYNNDFENGWKIISKSRYDDFVSYRNNNAHELLKDWASGEYDHYDDTVGRVSEFVNEDAFQASEEVDSATSELVNAEVSDSSFNTGEFTFDTEDLLSYPSFTVFVDAGENGYIEVTKPTGEPEIVSTSGAEIEEGSEEQVFATVENVGSGEGQFSGSLSSCGNGFTITDDQDTKNLAPGQSVTYSFDVSFSSASSDSREVSGSCDFQVQGLEYSDSSSIEVKGVQQAECSPGDQSRRERDDGRWEILECQSNGLDEEVVETCAEGEKAVAQGSNQFACEEPEDPGDPGDPGTPEPPTWIQDLVEQLHLGLSILAGLLASVAGYKGFRWIDGEYQVKGSFKPFKSRGLSRVDRGRFLIGVLGAVVGFAAGTLIASLIPLLVQLIVIAGIGVFLFYFGR
jgi:hypothetical protein